MPQPFSSKVVPIHKSYRWKVVAKLCYLQAGQKNISDGQNDLEENIQMNTFF